MLLAFASRTPNGIRTRAAALKGRCPRPLDDGGSTTTAALPVAPAVGDRFSIGDWRYRRQSGCYQPASDRQPADPARNRPAGPPRGTTRPSPTPTGQPARDPSERSPPTCLARLALLGLVDEILDDRGLLAFLGDNDPGDDVRENSGSDGNQCHESDDDPKQVDVHPGVVSQPGADPGDDPVVARAHQHLAVAVHVTHELSIPHRAWR